VVIFYYNLTSTVAHFENISGWPLSLSGISFSKSSYKSWRETTKRKTTSNVQRAWRINKCSFHNPIKISFNSRRISTYIILRIQYELLTKPKISFWKTKVAWKKSKTSSPKPSFFQYQHLSYTASKIMYNWSQELPRIVKRNNRRVKKSIINESLVPMFEMKKRKLRMHPSVNGW